MSTPHVDHPTRLPGDGTASLVRAWVSLYTRGLSAGQGADRQALVDADLWDEAEAADWMGETSGLARQRLGRWLRGVPSDLTWRLEQQRRITKVPRRTDMMISKVQLAVIGVVTAFYVVMLGGMLSEPDFRESTVMGVAIVGFCLVIVGLLLAMPRPPAGFVVGMLGIGILFVSMWWLFPFYLPLPIVLGYRLVRWQDAQPRSAPGA